MSEMPPKDLPAATQKIGLVDSYKEREESVLSKQLGVNKENTLRTKGDSGIQTKGLSGAQKWKAALVKIEEEELTSTLEKERVWEGPEAREGRPRGCRSVRG